MATPAVNKYSSRNWLEMKKEGNSDAEFLMLHLLDEGNNFLSQITGKLNLISVMGPARVGKSTIQNLLAGTEGGVLFPTSKRAQSFTRGVNLSTVTTTADGFLNAKITPDPSQLQITFVDTEGQGATSQEYDVRIFSPILVLSKVVLYIFKGGALKTSILTDLGTMVQAAKKIRTTKGGDGDGAGDKKKAFGHLVILSNMYAYSSDIDSLKEEILGMETKEKGDAGWQNRNEIRQLLYSVFESVELLCLDDDSLTVEGKTKLKNDSNAVLNINDFVDTYQTQFQGMRKYLHSVVSAPRRMDDVDLTGVYIRSLAEQLVRAVNSSEPMVLPDIFKMSQNSAINAALFDARSSLQSIYNDMYRGAGVAPQQLKFVDPAKKAVLGALKQLSFLSDDIVSKQRSILEGEIDNLNVVLIAHNTEKNATELNDSVTTYINNLDADLKQYSELKDSTIAGINQQRLLKVEEHEKLIKTFSQDFAIEQKLVDAALERYKQSTDKVSPAYVWKIETKWTDLYKAQRGKIYKQVTDNMNAIVSSNATDKEAQFTRLKNNLYQDVRAALADYLEKDLDKRVEDCEKELVRLYDIVHTNYQADVDQANSTIRDSKAELKQEYQTRIQLKILVEDEPEDKNTVFNYENILIKFKSAIEPLANASAQKKAQETDNLTSDLLEIKNKFWNKYDDTMNAYIKKLKESQLDKIKPEVYNRNAEKIRHFALQPTQSLSDSIDSVISQAKTEWDNSTNSIHGVKSLAIVAQYKQDLDNDILNTKKSQLLKNKTNISSMYGEKLSPAVQDVFDKLSQSLIRSDQDLDRRLDEARKMWEQQCSTATVPTSGAAETQLLSEIWNERMGSQKARMKESVEQARTAYEWGGATNKFQEDILRNIIPSVQGVAGALGMSYIGNGTSYKLNDIGKSGTADLRKYEAKSTYVGSSYDPNHPTSMRFHDWKVEYINMITDAPVFESLAPKTVTTVQFGPNPTEKEETVTKTITVSKNTSTEVGASAEMTMAMSHKVKESAKIEGVGGVETEQAFEWGFKVGGSFKKNDGNSSSDTITVTSKVLVPANKVVRVDMLQFDQKATVTFTAKVRVVPKVTFFGGFTAWGESYFRDGSGDNDVYHRDRKYQDIALTEPETYLNELRSQANSNRGNWKWETMLKNRQDYSPDYYIDQLSDDDKYTVRVRGRYQGIPGSFITVRSSIEGETVFTPVQM